tara:strand:+ start:644 stop:886 length:243 start_codon:yes stop_codon:yes gene_type:complete
MTKELVNKTIINGLKSKGIFIGSISSEVLNIFANIMYEALNIPVVVQQSEQLFCYHEGSYTLNEDGTCCKCHRLPKPKAK